MIGCLETISTFKKKFNTDIALLQNKQCRGHKYTDNGMCLKVVNCMRLNGFYMHV